METPTNPTNNLYKFLAIGGLVSLWLLSWFFVTQVHERRVKITKLEGEQKLLSVELRHLGLDTDSTSESLIKLLEIQKDRLKLPP